MIDKEKLINMLKNQDMTFVIRQIENGYYDVKNYKSDEITDTERLDFVEKNKLDISHWDTKNRYRCHDKNNEFRGGNFASIREAIDDEIRKTNDKKRKYRFR